MCIRDRGYVTLVNAKYDRNDQLVETDERTGLWAWKHPHHDGTTTYPKLAGDITFTDVDFGYVPEKTVLHGINLYGRPGQKIAFVGSTGAGKTTITNLINRFYDIQDGKIRYDGINIHKIKKADLRRSLGIVLQDTHLFIPDLLPFFFDLVHQFSKVLNCFIAHVLINQVLEVFRSEEHTSELQSQR